MMTADAPGDRCVGCWEASPHQGGRSPAFLDMRTGFRLCHECVSALVSWELDASAVDLLGAPRWVHATLEASI